MNETLKLAQEIADFLGRSNADFTVKHYALQIADKAICSDHYNPMERDNLRQDLASIAAMEKRKAERLSAMGLSEMPGPETAA